MHVDDDDDDNDDALHKREKAPKSAKYCSKQKKKKIKSMQPTIVVRAFALSVSASSLSDFVYTSQESEFVACLIPFCSVFKAMHFVDIMFIM